LLVSRKGLLCGILSNIKTKLSRYTATDVALFSRNNWAERHVSEECPSQMIPLTSNNTISFHHLVDGQVRTTSSLQESYLFAPASSCPSLGS
jgi:hypothetical protein